MFSGISSPVRFTRASRMYRPWLPAVNCHVRFWNAVAVKVGITCVPLGTGISDAGESESRNTRRLAATVDCVRPPWFLRVTVTSTGCPTRIAYGWRTFSTARSSSTSRDRSATITEPAGEMFRTFHPVRMFP